MLKKLMLVLVLGMTISVAADEKVVWKPKDGIGKTKTWKKKAEAELKDNVLVIKFNGEGWSGSGLNWQGYWPADSGIPIEDFKNLKITMKTTGRADGLSLTLKDNKHKPSGLVKAKVYCSDEKLPTEYTTVSIPLSDFLTEKSKLESKVIWEIMFGLYSSDAKDATVEIEKIAFSK